VTLTLLISYRYLKRKHNVYRGKILIKILNDFIRKFINVSYA